MERVLRKLCSVAALLAASQAHAQVPSGAVPDESVIPPVKIWTSTPPLSTAGSDDQFTRIVAWNIYYWQNPASNRTGAEMAELFASLIEARSIPEGRLAISIIGASLGNERWAAGSGDTRIPALFRHELDRLDPTDTIPLIANAPTPWMTNGIAEGAAWMYAFAQKLDTYVDNNDIPTPNRFLFDDEPNDFFSKHPLLNLSQTNSSVLVDYWEALLEDDRYDTVAVPGFGSDTLEDLWTAAHDNGNGVPAPTVPGTWQWQYLGGSPDNEKWVEWYRALIRQAEAGAMKTAFYDTLKDEDFFPNAKCSDYDRSLRFDGGNSTANSYIAADSSGASGSRLVFNAPGDLMAPTLYPNSVTNFYFSSICPDKWALTNDSANELDWCPVEPFENLALRLHRFNLDAMSRSFSGTYKYTLAPWIQLPGQSWTNYGQAGNVPDCTSSNHYFPANYGAGIRFRASCDYTRRILAHARSHGATEFNVWSNDTFGLSTSGMTVNTDPYSIVTYLNPKIHPQKNYPWERLDKIVDQVWSFDVWGANVVTGTTAGGTSGPVHSLAYDFGDPLLVTPASSGTYRTSVETVFTNAYTPVHGQPDRLLINVVAASTSDTVLHVEIKNFDSSSWDPVDLDPTTSGIQSTVNMDGGSTSGGGSPGPSTRVAGRVEVNSDHFGDFGSVIIRCRTEEMATPTGTNYLYYDLVQVVVDDDEDFSPADLDNDGDVDFTDVDIFYYLQIGEQTPTADQPLLLSFADFNFDGDVNSADEEDFMTVWSNDYTE